MPHQHSRVLQRLADLMSSTSVLRDAAERQVLGEIVSKLESIEQDVKEILDQLDDFRVVSKAIRWAAIFVGGLANTTYAGYYALTNILEAEGIWTLRLWMTTQERWWFTMATLILFSALALDIVAFLLGEDVDSSILLLSFELGVAINNVLIQAFRVHDFRKLLYECWCGQSRTARPRTQEWLRDVPQSMWHDAIAKSPVKPLTMAVESKWNPQNMAPTRWWHSFKRMISRPLRQENGRRVPLARQSKARLRLDLTEAMNLTAQTMHTERRRQRTQHGEHQLQQEGEAASQEGEQQEHRNPFDSAHIGEEGYLQVYVHHTATDMSVLWGGNNSKLFQKRVSRGILAIKTTQVIDAYTLRIADTDKWQVAIDGILARNKGLQPWRLVFCRTTQPDNPSETSSPLYPRASKTLYSRLRIAVQEQYGGLGKGFVEAGTELSLLVRDVNIKSLYAWLKKESEQQDLIADWNVYKDAGNERLNELAYLVQYVSMLLSLHFLEKLNYCRTDELVLLVAIKCLIEHPSDVDFGITIEDITEIETSHGEISLIKAKDDARRIGTNGIRILAGYLGLWISPETAGSWLQWIQVLQGGWSTILF